VLGGGKFLAWFAAAAGAFAGAAVLVAALLERSRKQGKPSRLRKAWRQYMGPLPPQE